MSMPLTDFNWQLARYAHPSWWPQLAAYMQGRAGPTDRLVARVSRQLLDELSLTRRYLDSTPSLEWVTWPSQLVRSLAFEIGLGALSLRYRNALDRQSVLSDLALIGNAGRRRAISYASQFERFANWGVGIKTPVQTRGDILDVGGDVLVSLIQREPWGKHRTGAAERFKLHFTKCPARIPELHDKAATEALKMASRIASVLVETGGQR